MAADVLLIQLVTPDYRYPLFDLLEAHWGDRFAVLAGDATFDASRRTPHPQRVYVGPAPTRFLWGRRLAWQRNVVGPALAAGNVIVELNPRILSGWAILAGRRLLGRPTLAWGHAWPRRGPGAWSDRVRNVMRRLAVAVICYTDADRDALGRRMPGKRIVAAPNALYSEAAIGAIGREPIDDFVFVGRLIAAKKPGLLLAAFAEARARGLPDDCRLTFAGAGPELDGLRAHADRDPRLAGRVRFLGHVPPDRVRVVYESALASVSPGYVGLSITQSFSVGVPMILAAGEPHSPEIEAAVDGLNAVFVPSDDAGALAGALLAVAADRERWVERRPAIAAACADRYTLERMAAGIVEAITPGAGAAALDEFRRRAGAGAGAGRLPAAAGLYGGPG